MQIPKINRHWVGLPALALAITGLAFLGNSAFERPVQRLEQVQSAQIAPPSNGAADIISQLKQIPKNAFGYAAPGAPSQNAVVAGTQPIESPDAEARDWTAEEWRLASAAVEAARKGGKKALNPTASSNLVWSPPEEIANRKPASGR